MANVQKTMYNFLIYILVKSNNYLVLNIMIKNLYKVNTNSLHLKYIMPMMAST